MIAGVAMLGVGLAGPFALRALAGRGSAPKLVIAAHLLTLHMVWSGLLSTTSTLFAPDTAALAHLCHTLTTWQRPPTAGDVVVLAVVANLFGRGAWAGIQTIRETGALRRETSTSAEQRHDFSASDLGTVALTLGFLRPRIVVDRCRFGRLAEGDREIVLAHERGHARGLHALVDLAIVVLGGGLQPWPGARVSRVEVRRHLEALADEFAVRRRTRRQVASTLARLAAAPSPGALGATGWVGWRLQRLLMPPRLAPARAGAWLLGISLLGLVGAQACLHALLGGHREVLHALGCLLASS